MLVIYACFSSLITVKTFFFTPRYQVKDEIRDIKYNAFQYSLIGTLLYGNPEVPCQNSMMKKDDTSVVKMIKDVFCKSMMSWSYLAFLVFYSGSVSRVLIRYSTKLHDEARKPEKVMTTRVSSFPAWIYPWLEWSFYDNDDKDSIRPGFDFFRLRLPSVHGESCHRA